MKFAYKNKIRKRWTGGKSRRPEPIVERHFVQRQGDEMACTCRARWPVGEDHPE